MPASFDFAGRALIRIAIDTLGGDAPAQVLVAGALDGVAATRAVDALVLTFFGDANVVAPLIRGTRHDVVHAPRRLEVADPLRGTLRGNIDSSMRAAIAAVAAGDADAVVSAGSTGALMALSRHLIGMSPGIRRPAIIKTLAGERGVRFRMLDLGANVGANPSQLHQFALMGGAAAVASGVRAPTVALLNIGSEVHKGPPAVRTADSLLDSDSRLRYVGYIEPDRIFAGAVDIVVADGFTGNIALKAAEGAARLAGYLLNRALADESPATAAKTLLGDRLDRVRDAYNPQRYNGANLLGLAKVVVKSHGAADRRGFASAVRQAVVALSGTLVARVAAGI